MVLIKHLFYLEVGITILCVFNFKKNKVIIKKTQKDMKTTRKHGIRRERKPLVFIANRNLRKSQQSFIQKVSITSVKLLRRTMISSCKKRFRKNHYLERLYWYMLIAENVSQINEKVLIHNLQTVKG